MPRPLFKPPKHIVREWPEVFEGLYINTMPVNYLNFLQIQFSNGRIWEININEQLSGETSDIVAERLMNIFQEYQDEISKIDFQIDIERLKKDIGNKTKKIL